MPPKPKIQGWPPKYLTPVTAAEIKKGKGPEAREFMETFCKVTNDSYSGRAGDPLVIRDWQGELLNHLLAARADGRRKHRQALIGMPRKSGKSAMLSSLTLYLLMLGPAGGECYAVASSRDQARIVFGTARRMVELEPELANEVTLYRDAIEVKSTGSIMRVLAAEAPQLEGLSPTAVTYDEVHTAPNRNLWDVLSLASAARVDPLMVGITTAGVRQDTSGQDSLCYSMYQYGQRVASGEVIDPSFFMAWYEPKKVDSDYRDPLVWAEANPGLGDLSDPEDFESSILRTPEAEFKTKRLNMWVATQNTWLPEGAWNSLDVEPRSHTEAPIILGLDGSFNNDSTAVIACSIEETPHIWVLGAWEKPTEAGNEWSVPIFDVEEAIRKACKSFNVREIVCDPYRWARSMQALQEEGLPIVEFPQSPQRMVPATQRFYEAVMNKTLTHDGDVRLTRHMNNAVLKTDNRGQRLSKDARFSARKIDLAVAAVMAFDRAATPIIQEEQIEPGFWAV